MKKHILALIAVSALTVSATSMAGGNAAAGKARAMACAGCHGANGMSMAPIYPNLKGQKEAYLVKQLKNFKSGVRKDPTMNAMAKPLSDADMANIAAHFAGLK